MKGSAEPVAKRIRDALNRVEEDAVRILYACESGSRAWGFESKDSDYDVVSSQIGLIKTGMLFSQCVRDGVRISD